jgi:sugar phosphate isomerase/epimerase
METHDAWCDPRHVAEVMERVDHPSIGVNWDIMHPVRNGYATVGESFDCLKGWISHVHFHDGVEVDGKLQLKPIGEGAIDHRVAVRSLAGSGYDGYLSGEWIKWEPWDRHLPREIGTMRSYEEEL